jgi:hypothetical protein
MDGVSAGDLGGRDDARDVEIRFARRCGSDADVVVSKANVQGFAIRLGVNRDGLDAELAAGANDAQRDLAAVRDQDFFKQVLPFRLQRLSKRSR